VLLARGRPRRSRMTAEATVASKHDPDTNFVAKRFYRVVQVP
jgi:hypothetical protein